MPEQNLTTLATLIGDDSHACSFQSLGQYRAALLKAIAQASASPVLSADDQVTALRRNGLSIDGDNAYKRDLIDCIVGAMAFGFQGVNPPPEGHWGKQFWDIGRAEGEARERLTNQRDAILLQARVWAGEAKTQQAITREVGEILDGVPNWRPIASGVEALRQQLADSHSTASSLQDLCRFLAASYCELDELRYTTAKLPANQISDFLIGKWPVIQGTANQMNIKRIADQPYDQVGALQGIIAMLAGAQPAEPYTDPRNGAETWSANGEDWHNIKSVEELISESQDDLEPLAEGDVVFVGAIRYQDPASFIDRDAVLTSMNENAGTSDASEWVDGYPNSDQAADEELTRVLEAWARKNCRPDFYLVDGAREYTITAEDIARALQGEQP